MGAALADGVLEACAAAGVREFCVCAGARNVALVVGLERSCDCRIWHFYDERSAAFFALGRMMQTGRPVAVVTTSGTAVAELLPATVEAYYQGLPLVLLTADRPPNFRGSGAPQAIQQVGILSDYARCLDLEAVGNSQCDEFLKRAVNAGQPAQLNLCFGEPDAAEIAAVKGADFAEIQNGSGETQVPEHQALLEFFLEDVEGLVVLLGNLQHAERVGLVDFLRRLGAPVVAEAGSGLREQLPGLIQREVPPGVRRVLRIGGVPSLRFWRDLESLPDLTVFSAARFSGLARGSELVPAVDWKAIAVPESCGFEGEIESVELAEEPRWLQFLSNQIPQDSAVLIGNSLPIREWNAAATFEDRGLRCFSCRGANGIDGQLSTFLGLSCDQQESWAIVGDLTALYDLGAPWALRELVEGRRRIVVINNGGGRIFSKLPALRDLGQDERRAIENDHAIEMRHWAAMWGMGYLCVEQESDFVPDENQAALVIEIMVGGSDDE